MSEDAITVLGKSSWIAEFLKRAEGSLLEAAEKVGEKDEITEFLETLLSENVWFSLLMTPEVFAYGRQYHIENFTPPIKLEELLNHNNQADTIGDHGLSLYKTPHDLFLIILRNMKRGSRGEDSSKASFLEAEHPLYAEHLPRIKDALDLMKELTPEYHQVVTTFLNTILFVDEHASFRGSTSYNARGASYFYPKEKWDAYVWAEELLHEATHNYMKTILTFDPLLTGENSYDLVTPGPLRSDLRHHYGNFQAVHVISRMIRLNTAFIENGHKADFITKRTKDLYERCQTPYIKMLEEAEFSEIGQEIFDAEVKTIFSPRTSPSKTSWFQICPDILSQF